LCIFLFIGLTNSYGYIEKSLTWDDGILTQRFENGEMLYENPDLCPGHQIPDTLRDSDPSRHVDLDRHGSPMQKLREEQSYTLLIHSRCERIGEVQEKTDSRRLDVVKRSYDHPL
jgi:hypothetical protein